MLRKGETMASAALQDRGIPRTEVMDSLGQRKHGTENMPWRSEKMLRPSYFAGEDVLAVAQDAFKLFMSENWLYSRTSFPALGQLEDEVIASMRALLHAPESGGGVLTSGGTESLMMAVRIPAHRARERDPGLERLNIVLPWSAHPGLDKAADLMGIEVRRPPPSDRLPADVDWMAKACDRNTVLLVGSAPPYPHGVVDPIEELSRLAESKGIWLHVDACLGGMILPFAEAAGRPVPAWDFRLPGVRSISADLHKFGYAVKGISALTLRDAADARHGKTTFTNWPAGLYGTPGVSGTRSGGALASAWAVMRYLGFQGYVERTAKVLDYRDSFMAELRGIGARILGEPQCFHFAFQIDGVDPQLINEGLAEAGWYVATLERPASVQVMVNYGHGGMAKRFAEAVAATVREVRSGQRRSSGKRSVYSM